MPKERVFLDTNVIIESFRIGCWTAICARHNRLATSDVKMQ